jgi:WD40 repeat protein
MTALAFRRRRRRRIAVGVTITVLVAGLAVVGGFWRRSVLEARRAEAANLFSLAQLQLEEHPTATIAYALASLELVDSPEVRRLVLEALWLGPTEIRLETNAPYIGSLDFSADGRWLATAEPGGTGRLWPSDGGPPIVLDGDRLSGEIRMSLRGDLVAASWRGRREVGLWSFPEGRSLRSIPISDQPLMTLFFGFSPDGNRLFTARQFETDERARAQVRSWPVTGGEPTLLALFGVHEESREVYSCVDPTGSRIAWPDGRRVRIARVEGTTVHLASATSVLLDRPVSFFMFDGRGRQLATVDAGGGIGIWSLEHDPPLRTHTLSGFGGWNAIMWLSDSGSMLAGVLGLLWDLSAPMEVEPLQLRHSAPLFYGLEFHPDDRWLATSAGEDVSLWPLARGYPRVFRGHEDRVTGISFTPDGERLASVSQDGTVRVWPVRGGARERSRILRRAEGVLEGAGKLAMAPDRAVLLIGHRDRRMTLIPLDGGEAREFGDSAVGLLNYTHIAVGPGARLVAAHGRSFVRIWDLESGEVSVLEIDDGTPNPFVKFTDDGDLWVSGGGKLRRWQFGGESPRKVMEMDLAVPDGTTVFYDDLSPDGRQVLLGADDGRMWIQDVATRDTRELRGHAGRATDGYAWLDPAGEIVVSVDEQGGIRVSRVTGGDAHLLLGCDAGDVQVSPDHRWVAAACRDASIRLWPMPDLSKPPLHTLPREELIATLKTLTNLRPVPDEDSPTGWNIEVGPFPGWETVPGW